ncbi:hypothetical protein LCGC14_0223910 [marine sediment metagenome]|uniref:Uncharacterized protein n=1 Tax=marine sediment metagenome TaxID=412755 RepID=A0A0F9XFZ3_9ZZZZ
MTRPKLPEEYKKEHRYSFTVNKKQKELMDKFVNKSEFFRSILFSIMPKVVSTFIKKGVKIDLTDEEIRIIKIYSEELNK